MQTTSADDDDVRAFYNIYFLRGSDGSVTRLTALQPVGVHDDEVRAGRRAAPLVVHVPAGQHRAVGEAQRRQVSEREPVPPGGRAGRPVQGV